jgi:hypothetical protein
MSVRQAVQELELMSVREEVYEIKIITNMSIPV